MRLFTNNALARLTTDLLASAVPSATFSVTSGLGALFASPTTGDYQVITLSNPQQTLFETLHLTARATDTFTVLRAQEGTTAQNWSAGTLVYGDVTAGILSNLLTDDDPQTISQQWTFRTPPTINATSGFTGSLLDLQVGGSSVASIDQLGVLHAQAVEKGSTSLTEVNGVTWITYNATYDTSAGQWNRVNTTDWAFGFSLNAPDPNGGTDTGMTYWTASPAANPIGVTYNSAGSWETSMFLNSSGDLKVLGSEIAVAGGAFTSGRAHTRLINFTQSGNSLGPDLAGLLTNMDGALSVVDDAGADSWFMGYGYGGFAIAKAAANKVGYSSFSPVMGINDSLADITMDLYGTAINRAAQYSQANANANGTVTLDLSSAQHFDLTLTGNVTLAFGSIPSYNSSNYLATIITRQDSTGNRVITWPNTFNWLAYYKPTYVDRNAGAVHIYYVLFTPNGTYAWYDPLSAIQSRYAKPNGLATLDANGQLVGGQVPTDVYTHVYRVTSTSDMVALSNNAAEGDIAIVTDTTTGAYTAYVNNGLATDTITDWTEISQETPPVTSVFGRTGDVVAKLGDYNSTLIMYANQITLEDLRPLEINAEQTTGKSLTLLIDRTVDNMSVSATRSYINPAYVDGLFRPTSLWNANTQQQIFISDIPSTSQVTLNIGGVGVSTINLDTQVSDGTTYARTLLSYLDAGRPNQLWRSGSSEAWPSDNFSLHNEVTQHIGGLNVPTVNMDNQVLDGTTFGRTLLSRLSGGKPFVDFSEGLNLNQNLDYLGDTPNYTRLPYTKGNRNLIPDSGFKTVAATSPLYWIANSWTLLNAKGVDGGNAMGYLGTGSATGTNHEMQLVHPILMAPGTYLISAYIDCTNVTAGNPGILVEYGVQGTSGLSGIELGSDTGLIGGSDRYYNHFTINVANSWAAGATVAPPYAITDSNGNVQAVQTGGTTGTNPPTWATSPGSTTTDGGVTWKMITNDPTQIPVQAVPYTFNCTINSGVYLVVSNMQLEPMTNSGVPTPYTENTGNDTAGTQLIDFASSAHSSKTMDYILDGLTRYGAIHDSSIQTTMKSNSDKAGLGLDTSGAVQLAIPTAIQTLSNILGRAGGGTFTGDLNSTYGSDYLTNTTNRPANTHNLVNKPAFSDGLVGDWSAASSNATVSSDTTIKALKVLSVAGGLAEARELQNTFAVVSGQTLYISANIDATNVTSGATFFGVEFLDSNGAQVSAGTGQLAQATSGTVSVSITVPGNAVTAYPVFYLSTNAVANDYALLNNGYVGFFQEGSTVGAQFGSNLQDTNGNLVTQITGALIAPATITGTLIAGQTITGSLIANGTITATNIASGTITATQIAAGTITSSEINVSQLSALSADLGTVTAGTIQDLNGQFVIDLANSVLHVYDTQATPQLRVELGLLANSDYGLHVYDSAGTLLFDSTGAQVVGGTSATTIQGQITAGDGNLLPGTLAGQTLSGTGTAPIVFVEYISGGTTTGKLSSLFIKTGYNISVGADIWTSGAVDNIYLTLEAYDSSGSLIKSDSSPALTASSPTLAKIESFVIPTNTDHIKFYVAHPSGTETVYAENPSLNMGALYKFFTPIRFVPRRDTADILRPGSARSFIHPNYIDSAFRPVTLHRATGGIDVTADNLSQHSEVTQHIGGLNVPTVGMDSQVADGVNYSRQVVTTANRNLIPDSGFKTFSSTNTLYWYSSQYWVLRPGEGADGGNAIGYLGTGTAASYYVASPARPIIVKPGNYIVSAWVDGSHITSGSASIYVGFSRADYTTTTKSVPGAPINITSSDVGRYHNSFAITVGTWSAGATYTSSQLIADSNGALQVVITGGTAGSTPPTWGTTIGSQTTDGGVTWELLNTDANYVPLTVSPDTSACTVASGEYLLVSNLQLEILPAAGVPTPYQENTGDDTAGTLLTDFANPLHANKHGGSIPTSASTSTTLDHSFLKSSPTAANDATAINYSASGPSVDSLRPAEVGAQKGAQNVLGPDAHPEYSGTTSQPHIYGDTIFPGGSSSGGYSLDALGIASGDVISASIQMKSTSGTDALTGPRVIFYDSTGAQVGSQYYTINSGSTTYVTLKYNNITVPANAVYVSLRPYHSVTTETVYLRWAALYKSGACPGYVPPPFLPHRDTTDNILASGNRTFIAPAYVNEDLSVAALRRSENYIRYSQDYTNGTYWGLTNATITAGIIAPDGSSTAQALVDSSQTTAHAYRLGQTTPLPTGQDVVASIYAEASTLTEVLVLLSDSSESNYVGGYVDLSNGTVISNSNVGSGTLTAVTVTPDDNNFYRIAVYGNLPSGSNNTLYVYLAKSGTDSYIGDGTGRVVLWGAQIEPGTTLSKYAPTTGSTLTDRSTLSANNTSLHSEVTSHIGGLGVATIDFGTKTTGRTADKITYTGSGTPSVDSLQPAQAGADVTLKNLSIVQSQDWTSPISSTMGYWSLYSGNISNMAISTTTVGPYGGYPPVCQVRGDGATSPGWYGGLDTFWNIDTTRGYMIAIWLSPAASTTYSGIYVGLDSAIEDFTGTAINNYYFASNVGINSGLTAGDWYLAVTYIHPYGVTTDSGQAGLWDPTTGQRKYTAPEVRSKSTATNHELRFGFWSNSTVYTTSDGANFAQPLVYLMDGNQPTIQQLLRTSATLGNFTADDLAESSTKKWAAEHGADITSSHTALDTTNVNGIAAATVQSHAQTGYNLTVAGSGQVIGGGFNIIPLNTAGYATAYWTGLTLTSSYQSGTNTATINGTAATLHAGSESVNYNSWSVSGLSPGATYYLGVNDPTFSGGTPTIVTATSKSAIINNDAYIYIGSYTTPTSSGGGGGSLGGCVSLDMYIAEDLVAARAHPTTIVACADEYKLIGTRVVHDMVYATEPCVRLVADNGAALVCSSSTPFTLSDGSSKYAPDMLNEKVLTDKGEATITSVTDAGVIPVAKISVSGLSYAAGEDATNRIYSHNTLKP